MEQGLKLASILTATKLCDTIHIITLLDRSEQLLLSSNIFVGVRERSPRENFAKLR